MYVYVYIYILIERVHEKTGSNACRKDPGVIAQKVKSAVQLSS